MKVKEPKKPIPNNVSGVAYICTNGYVKYCTTGTGIKLPKDFKQWLGTTTRQ